MLAVDGARRLFGGVGASRKTEESADIRAPARMGAPETSGGRPRMTWSWQPFLFLVVLTGSRATAATGVFHAIAGSRGINDYTVEVLGNALAFLEPRTG